MMQIAALASEITFFNHAASQAARKVWTIMISLISGF
jgi:hypothetical protein